MYSVYCGSYGKDESMTGNRLAKKRVLCGLGLLAVTAAIGLGAGQGAETATLFSKGGVITAYAQEDMLGYQNPERIVIASPSTDNYSTTAANISILGACDYRYPLTMNGETLEITEHGFFTTYVTLSVGENVFFFENGEHEYRLVVTRKKSSGSSGGGGSTSVYKEVSNKMGELIYSYTMPYSAPGTVQIDYLPLTKNTTFRIVGEYGSYYKLPDGTYVSKSAVKVYPYAMPKNKVNSSAIKYEEATHTVATTFSMKIDALYDVQVNGDTVKFVLYDTTAGGNPSVPDNPLVKSVTAKTDDSGRAIYTYTLYDGGKLCGFDVVTKNGTMTFTMKYAPVLKQKGSLEGAVILLDAGHGGTDSGTVGAMGSAGPTEKTVNLDLTLRTKKALEEMGAKVVMVRSTDVYYTLDERVELIRSTKPDLSVSIHNNAMGITSDYAKSSGFLTFYSYNNIQDAAGIINASVNKSMGYAQRTIRKSNLSLTRLTACPAVLLESAFLTNPDDYEYMLKSSNREKLAQAIANAAKDYIESVAEYEQEYEPAKTHTVKKGDTLTSIAKKYGVTVAALAKVNRIENINIIHTGSVLVIPN